jgi:hypothetical protein
MVLAMGGARRAVIGLGLAAHVGGSTSRVTSHDRVDRSRVYLHFRQAHFIVKPLRKYSDGCSSLGPRNTKSVETWSGVWIVDRPLGRPEDEFLWEGSVPVQFLPR